MDARAHAKVEVEQPGLRNLMCACRHSKADIVHIVYDGGGNAKHGFQRCSKMSDFAIVIAQRRDSDGHPSC